MRWNCPHCGVTLAVPDEKLNPGWSYTRCFQCGGFALLRRSDQSVIKMDGSPETHSPPLSTPATQENLMGQRAVEHLQSRGYTVQNFRGQSAKPVIRKSTRSLQFQPLTQAPTLETQVSQSHYFSSPQSLQNQAATQALTHQRPITRDSDNSPSSALPSPLPKIPEHLKDWRTKSLPIAIGAAGALAAFSGIYLTIQGQNLWRKSLSVSTPQKIAKHKERNDRVLPISDDLIIGSRSGSNILHSVRPQEDQIRTQAPAPIRQKPNQKGTLEPGQILEEGQAGYVIVHNEAARKEAQFKKEEIQEYLSEEVEMLKAVEKKPKPRAQTQVREMLVKPRTTGVRLRSGPGMHFAPIGKANTQKTYVVEDWSKNWFKIHPRTQKKISYWIRNDFVIPIGNSQPSPATRPTQKK